jgi:hypothetical protein
MACGVQVLRLGRRGRSACAVFDSRACAVRCSIGGQLVAS